MALRIVELFGYAPDDLSPAAVAQRTSRVCPFVGVQCNKRIKNVISGVCAVQPAGEGPVICCPRRLYSDNYKILQDVAEKAFGPGVELACPQEVRVTSDSRIVIALGKETGQEVRLPKRRGRGSYFVDWVLVRLQDNGDIGEFIAVEVQSIDTTGNYRTEWEAYMAQESFAGFSKAGLNWENVSKRILPQIIYKGHVLRRERLCKKGMFFICPGAVYQRIVARLGGELLSYSLQPGSLTFMWYDLGPKPSHGHVRSLNRGGDVCTTIDQVALAFTAPRDLPPENVYEQAIRSSLGLQQEGSPRRKPHKQGASFFRWID